jgi:nucleoside-diphosphate-sugar epimerase
MARGLITGGSGFIGTHLVEHHLRLRHSVRAIDLLTPRLPGHLPQREDEYCPTSVHTTDAVYDTQPIHGVAGPDPHSLQAAVTLTCDWLTQQRVAA